MFQQMMIESDKSKPSNILQPRIISYIKSRENGKKKCVNIGEQERKLTLGGPIMVPVHDCM